ncbi:hypothetical protein LguiB_010390 [Lonicera macranthoides]
MARENYNFATLILVIVVGVMLTGTRAETYYVGDSNGWMVPQGGAAAYAAWAAQHAFNVGDVLVFNFTTGMHDVAKVTSQDFGPCNANNPISVQRNGPANVTLDSAPQQFFVCSFSNHCSLGQKLQINLNTTSPSPGSSPNAATPPPPPPQGSSAARAAATTFSLIFLYTAMIYLLC